MFDVPKEAANTVQDAIDNRVNDLWKELIQTANGNKDVKRCREILDLIDLNKSNSVLLWRV